MSDHVDPLLRADAMVEVIGDAHLAIFDTYREAFAVDAPSARIKALLDEAVRIVLQEAPAVLAPARAAARDAELRSMLDPAQPDTDGDLARIIQEAESELTLLLHRQEEIADELRRLVDRD